MKITLSTPRTISKNVSVANPSQASREKKISMEALFLPVIRL
jgi:hypothetical protein